MESKEYTLDQTGNSPLIFNGILLQEANCHDYNGPLNMRWYSASIYETTGGAYILNIKYHTKFDNEMEESSVLVCKSIPEIRNAINEETEIVDNIMRITLRDRKYMAKHIIEKKKAYQYALSNGWKYITSIILQDFPEHVE